MTEKWQLCEYHKRKFPNNVFFVLFLMMSRNKESPKNEKLETKEEV